MKEIDCPNTECPYHYISEKRNRDNILVSRTPECLKEKQHEPCIEKETEVEEKTDTMNLGC